MTDRAGTLLEGRRERLERILGRELSPPTVDADDPLQPEQRKYLFDEARDLYWNDLEWEHITDEESLEDGPLVELAFPGFLAFVRGLLLEEVMPDAMAPPNPRPEVVSDILHFLAGRVVELEEDGDDHGKESLALDMTARLIDLVLYRYHGLDAADVERVDAQEGASG